MSAATLLDFADMIAAKPLICGGARLLNPGVIGADGASGDRGERKERRFMPRKSGKQILSKSLTFLPQMVYTVNIGDGDRADVRMTEYVMKLAIATALLTN